MKCIAYNFINMVFLPSYSSCVYKCVCKQFSERLYSDLLNEITGHLQRLSRELQASIERFCWINTYISEVELYLIRTKLSDGLILSNPIN